MKTSIRLTRRFQSQPYETMEITVGVEDDNTPYDDLYDDLKVKLIEAEHDFAMMYGKYVPNLKKKGD